MSGQVRSPQSAGQLRRRLIQFLTQRMTEELSRLWARELARKATYRGPSLATQLDVVDEILGVLATDRLPGRNDLVVLLDAYRKHTEFDPRWAVLT